MSRNTLYIILSVLAVLTGTGSRAASPLKDDPSITRGTLPNGITYYVATNPVLTRKADFALVQKDFLDEAASRKALVELPVFGKRRPLDFMADRGVGYNRNGFISYGSGSTVFHFRNVPLDQATTDSTLLMMLGIAGTCPGSQAIMVSGDVKAADIAQKLNLLSLLVSGREIRHDSETYVWEPNPNPTLNISASPAEGVSSIRISYSMPRIPKDKMNTLQPFVSRQYASYLGTILAKRIRVDFNHSRIPLADIRYRYISSADGPGDEQCAVTVMTSTERYGEAVDHIARILSSLDEEGAGLVELQDAKDRLAAVSRREAGTASPDNGRNIRRCTAAFLYGASLAPDSEIASFFGANRLSGEKELELFNNFVSALLSPRDNMTIGVDATSTEEGISYAGVFRSGWDAGKADDGAVLLSLPDYGDTLGLAVPDPKARVKIKTVGKDVISGGAVWTFSNGMKVIWKKTAVKGVFSYAMLLRGGSASVRDISGGESAFVGDMLKISDIAGLTGESFHEMLLANGVTMEERVSLSDMCIRGYGPSSKLSLVLRSLLSTANDRHVNRNSFDNYRQSEALRIQLRKLTAEGVREELDSLLAPGSIHPEKKSIDALKDDLPERAGEFFGRQFSKCADGVLIILGDLDEEKLKRELCMTLGSFRTDKVYATIPQVRQNYHVGTVTLTEMSADSHIGDGSQSVNIAITTPVQFTLENYLAYRLAMVALSNELSMAMIPVGASAELGDEVEFYPAGRLKAYITCKPCRESGLPEGIRPGEPLNILDNVRAALRVLSSMPLGKDRLERYKTELTARIAAELADDSLLMDAIINRYSFGKDLVTGYEKAIKGISSETVEAAVGSLCNGGRIEYVAL